MLTFLALDPQRLLVQQRTERDRLICVFGLAIRGCALKRVLRSFNFSFPRTGVVN